MNRHRPPRLSAEINADPSPAAAGYDPAHPPFGVALAVAQPDRRALLTAAAAMAAALAATAGAPLPASAQGADHAAGTVIRSLAVLDFELIDDQKNPLTVAAQTVRLREATAQLQRELAERRLYRVADTAPAAPLLVRLREQQEFMHRCDDCIAQVGRQLGVELVMSTWVQKVSELILNVNVQIHETASEKLLFTKSVDMRGNDDVSWTRAVRFLVRDMADKRARNPAYAQ